MVTTIYQPRDTRMEEIFQPLAYGLGAVGKHFGERKRQEDRAAAITQLLAEPGQTQEQLLTKIMGSPEFADDPQAAVQMATSLYQAKQADLQGERSKAVVHSFFLSNPEMFKGVSEEDIAKLPPDQASDLMKAIVDAQVEKRNQELTARGQDIQKDLGLEGIKVQREQIGASAAQSAAQLKQQAEQFNATHELDILKTHADILRSNADTAQTEANTRLTTLQADLAAATSDDQRAKLKAEIEATKADVEYRQALAKEASTKADLATLTAPADIEKAQAELAKTQAEIKAIEAKTAAAPGEAAKTAAETDAAKAAAEKSRAEAAKASAETSTGMGGQKEFEAQAAGIQDRYKKLGIDLTPQQALVIAKAEPQAVNLLAAKYGGKFDPNDPMSFTFGNKASPEDKAKGNMANFLLSKSLAATGGDVGASVDSASTQAETIFPLVKKARDESSGDDDASVSRAYQAAAAAIRARGLSLSPQEIGHMLDIYDSVRP